jgi:hypothetical protein
VRKDYNTNIYFFYLFVLWVWNLVYHAEGEKHRLQVFENRVLRGNFGLKKKDVTHNDRHNEKLHDVHSSLNIDRMMKLR